MQVSPLNVSVYTITKRHNQCPIHRPGQSDNARRQGMMAIHAFTAPLI